MSSSHVPSPAECRVSDFRRIFSHSGVAAQLVVNSFQESEFPKYIATIGNDEDDFYANAFVTMDEESAPTCVTCANKRSMAVRLQLYQINDDEALWMCAQEGCVYPLIADESIETFIIKRNSMVMSMKSFPASLPVPGALGGCQLSLDGAPHSNDSTNHSGSLSPLGIVADDADGSVSSVIKETASLASHFSPNHGNDSTYVSLPSVKDPASQSVVKPPGHIPLADFSGYQPSYSGDIGNFERRICEETALGIDFSHYLPVDRSGAPASADNVDVSGKMAMRNSVSSTTESWRLNDSIKNSAAMKATSTHVISDSDFNIGEHYVSMKSNITNLTPPSNSGSLNTPLVSDSAGFNFTAALSALPLGSDFTGSVIDHPGVSERLIETAPLACADVEDSVLTIDAIKADLAEAMETAQSIGFQQTHDGVPVSSIKDSGSDPLESSANQSSSHSVLDNLKLAVTTIGDVANKNSLATLRNHATISVNAISVLENSHSVISNDNCGTYSCSDCDAVASIVTSNVALQTAAHVCGVSVVTPPRSSYVIATSSGLCSSGVAIPGSGGLLSEISCVTPVSSSGTINSSTYVCTDVPVCDAQTMVLGTSVNSSTVLEDRAGIIELPCILEPEHVVASVCDVFEFLGEALERCMPGQSDSLPAPSFMNCFSLADLNVDCNTDDEGVGHRILAEQFSVDYDLLFYCDSCGVEETKHNSCRPSISFTDMLSKDWTPEKPVLISQQCVACKGNQGRTEIVLKRFPSLLIYQFDKGVAVKWNSFKSFVMKAYNNTRQLNYKLCAVVSIQPMDAKYHLACFSEGKIVNAAYDIRNSPLIIPSAIWGNKRRKMQVFDVDKVLPENVRCLVWSYDGELTASGTTVLDNASELLPKCREDLLVSVEDNSVKDGTIITSGEYIVPSKSDSSQVVNAASSDNIEGSISHTGLSTNRLDLLANVCSNIFDTTIPAHSKPGHIAIPLVVAVSKDNTVSTVATSSLSPISVDPSFKPSFCSTPLTPDVSRNVLSVSATHLAQVLQATSENIEVSTHEEVASEHLALNSHISHPGSKNSSFDDLSTTICTKIGFFDANKAREAKKSVCNSVNSTVRDDSLEESIDLPMGSQQNSQDSEGVFEGFESDDQDLESIRSSRMSLSTDSRCDLESPSVAGDGSFDKCAIDRHTISGQSSPLSCLSIAPRFADGLQEKFPPVDKQPEKIAEPLNVKSANNAKQLIEYTSGESHSSVKRSTKRVYVKKTKSEEKASPHQLSLIDDVVRTVCANILGPYYVKPVLGPLIGQDGLENPPSKKMANLSKTNQVKNETANCHKYRMDPKNANSAWPSVLSEEDGRISDAGDAASSIAVAVRLGESFAINEISSTEKPAKKHSSCVKSPNCTGKSALSGDCSSSELGKKSSFCKQEGFEKRLSDRASKRESRNSKYVGKLLLGSVNLLRKVTSTDKIMPERREVDGKQHESNPQLHTDQVEDLNAVSVEESSVRSGSEEISQLDFHGKNMNYLNEYAKLKSVSLAKQESQVSSIPYDFNSVTGAARVNVNNVPEVATTLACGNETVSPNSTETALSRIRQIICSSGLHCFPTPVVMITPQAPLSKQLEQLIDGLKGNVNKDSVDYEKVDKNSGNDLLLDKEGCKKEDEGMIALDIPLSELNESDDNFIDIVLQSLEDVNMDSETSELNKNNAHESDTVPKKSNTKTSPSRSPRKRWFIFTPSTIDDRINDSTATYRNSSCPGDSVSTEKSSETEALLDLVSNNNSAQSQCVSQVQSCPAKESSLRPRLKRAESEPSACGNYNIGLKSDFSSVTYSPKSSKVRFGTTNATARRNVKARISTSNPEKNDLLALVEGVPSAADPSKTAKLDPKYADDKLREAWGSYDDDSALPTKRMKLQATALKVSQNNSLSTEIGNFDNLFVRGNEAKAARLLQKYAELKRQKEIDESRKLSKFAKITDKTGVGVDAESASLTSSTPRIVNSSNLFPSRGIVSSSQFGGYKSVAIESAGNSTGSDKSKENCVRDVAGVERPITAVGVLKPPQLLTRATLRSEDPILQRRLAACLKKLELIKKKSKENNYVRNMSGTASQNGFFIPNSSLSGNLSGFTNSLSTQNTMYHSSTMPNFHSYQNTAIVDRGVPLDQLVSGPPSRGQMDGSVYSGGMEPIDAAGLLQQGLDEYVSGNFPDNSYALTMAGCTNAWPTDSSADSSIFGNPYVSDYSGSSQTSYFGMGADIAAHSNQFLQATQNCSSESESGASLFQAGSTFTSAITSLTGIDGGGSPNVEGFYANGSGDYSASALGMESGAESSMIEGGQSLTSGFNIIQYDEFGSDFM